MKERVPKINVSGKVEDVKRTETKVSRPWRRSLPSEVLLPRKRGWLRFLGWIFLGAIFLALITFGAGLYYAKYRLPSLLTEVQNLQSAASGLKLPGLQIEESESSFTPDVSIFGNFFGAFGDLRGLTRDLSALALQAGTLGETWPEIVLGGRGEELISELREARERIASVYDTSERLRTLAGLSPWGAAHLPVQIDLLGLRDFLDSFIPWLDSEDSRRILVLLQNPSELRPGGGFVGSYAEVELRRGSVARITVMDVNDADRDSSLKIVPPEPLQLIATRWRVADANWFFDFSDSAGKVLDLFEDSDRYDAVIGVSAEVIREILEIAGPVELKNRDLTLTGENFLVELQKIVQAGQAERNDYPKAVLGEFAPALTDKILSMDEAQKNELAFRLGRWTERKDVQVNFRDPELQRFFEYLGIAGRVFQAPEIWSGDYLAVVYANVEGGKSDLYLREKSVLQSQINIDGTLSNHLVLRREHAGRESEYWWYREPNQGYMKIFVPPDAKLTYASGGIEKTVRPKVNYVRQGYSKDPLVSAIEESREVHSDFPAVERFLESGKRVFGTWVKTDLGKTNEVVFDYSRRLPFAPADGGKYEFVFERQSGASGEYSFQINAPVGFRFRENNLPVFEYESSDPPGRLILSLTLEKI